MKRIIFVLLLIALGSAAIFAQSSPKPKPAVKTAPKIVVDREKFDPTRDVEADLQATIIKAQKENKRIVLDVGGEWCGWCIHMDKFIAANSELKKLRDENYVWLKINMSEENENKEFLAKYPEIKGYPHLFILEKDGTLLKSQDTSELEADKTYNLRKFTDFLTGFASIKTSRAK